MGETNPYERRSRAVKAFRLARVVVHASAAAGLDAAAWLDAPAPLRSRVAALAGTRPPSDETWRAAVAIAAETLDARYHRRHA